MSPTPWRSSSLMIAVPAAPAPETTTRTSARSLADHPQRVGQRGQHADRGAVLVVVEDRDVQQLAQPRLDLEAARRGDVLQVDAAVRRGDRPHDRDDLVGVLGVQHHRPGVHAAEPLEQRGLALHHRHRRGRADVAQAEHGRAVGDHGDGVALDGQAAGVGRVLRDRQADPGHPRRVRPGQLVAVAQRDLRRDLDLAAEVQQERPVGDLADVDAVQLLERLDDLVGVGGVGGVAGEVDDARWLVSESTTSSAVTIAAGLADRGGQPADRRGVGGDGDPDGDREPGAGQAGASSRCSLHRRPVASRIVAHAGHRLQCGDRGGRHVRQRLARSCGCARTEDVTPSGRGGRPSAYETWRSRRRRPPATGARGAARAAPGRRPVHRARRRHRGRVPPAAAGAGRPGRRLDRGHASPTPRTRWPSWPRWPRPPARRCSTGLIQRRSRPDPATYIGRGKVDELRDVVLATGADTVICDGELSPVPAAQPGGADQGQGRRPDRADPGHLRPAREEQGGQGAGRAGPAAVPAAAPARLG